MKFVFIFFVLLLCFSCGNKVAYPSLIGKNKEEVVDYVFSTHRVMTNEINGGYREFKNKKEVFDNNYVMSSKKWGILHTKVNKYFQTGLLRVELVFDKNDIVVEQSEVVTKDF